MAISSSCIFHFTDNVSTLYKILGSKCFLPSYCKEKSGLDRESFVRVPMVSFCDIPLTQTSEITSYGRFAIGMKMCWALSNRLNPVFYLPENSLVFERNKVFAETLNEFSKINAAKESFNNIGNDFTKIAMLIFSKEFSKLYSSEFKIPEKLINPLQDVYLSFFQNIKEYGGILKRGDKIIENYKFYNEREWRYIPTEFNSFEKKYLPFINEIDWDNNLKNYFGEKPHFSSKNGLSFMYEDIDYIIVDNEKRIKPLINKLKKIFPNEYEMLLTKVISFDKIKSDF